MTQVNDVVKKLVIDISLDLPADDVHGFSSGPTATSMVPAACSRTGRI